MEKAISEERTKSIEVILKGQPVAVALRDDGYRIYAKAHGTEFLWAEYKQCEYPSLAAAIAEYFIPVKSDFEEICGFCGQAGENRKIKMPEIIKSEDSSDSDNDMQKNCGDCGVFITKDRWIKKNRPDNAYPVCADCQEKYEDPEFF